MRKTKNYKNVMYTILLFSQLCVGQEVYKVTEGELHYINRELGIILKKEGKYFTFKINSLQLYGLQDGATPRLEEVSPELILNYINKPETILAGDIDPSGLKDFENYRFVLTVDGKQSQIYKYNNELLAIRSMEKRVTELTDFSTYEYIILDFGNNKKIIYCYHGSCIVPKSKEMHFFIGQFNEYSSKKIRLKPLKTVDISSNFLFESFYKLDTLPNKKLAIRNKFKKPVINTEFDSIWHNNNFIVGYHDKQYTIYNTTFTSLKLNGIKAFSFKDYFPLNLQVIQKNRIRSINVLGKDFDYGDDGPYDWVSNDFPAEVQDFEVYKENDAFFIRSAQKLWSMSDLKGIDNTRVYRIYHCENIENLEFIYTVDYITTDPGYITHSGTYLKYPVLIYSRLKNGKYDINTIDYLLSENPSGEIERQNAALPKNLESIERIDSNTYLISKDGLQTYYPIMKDIKYQNLSKFTGNFVRFKLPDGRKGWLSLDGREYMDE